MKALIQSLIDALPDFANVGVFMVFVFILFATMGLEQYNGAYYNTCKLTPAPINSMTWASDLSVTRVCSVNGQGNYACPNNEYCGNIEQYPDIPIESEHLD